MEHYASVYTSSSTFLQNCRYTKDQSQSWILGDMRSMKRVLKQSSDSYSYMVHHHQHEERRYSIRASQQAVISLQLTDTDSSIVSFSDGTHQLAIVQSLNSKYLDCFVPSKAPSSRCGKHHRSLPIHGMKPTPQSLSRGIWKRQPRVSPRQ
jgi:hypothetical protein